MIRHRLASPLRGAAAEVSGLWFGQPFNAKNNSLNLLRLILATTVLFHHSFPLLGLGAGPDLLGQQIGTWAVYAFFALSGYLIVASRLGKSFGEYLMLRIARIMPAFIVCLLVTALLFAPLNWWHVNGTLSGYWRSTTTTPFAYVFNNLGLRMTNYDVAGTPIGVHYPGVWNGSLWSLYFEFVCYILLGILGLFTLVRRSPWPLAAVWLATVLLKVYFPTVITFAKDVGDLAFLSSLMPYFFAGSVLQVFKRRVGIHWLPAIASALAFLGLLLVDKTWGGQAGSVFLAYFLLWLGHTMPSPAWVKANDISYGMYIYAFQCQQLVITFKPAWGYWRESLVALAMATACAVASWFWIEKPILDRARRGPRSLPTRPPTDPIGTLVPR